MHSDFLNQRLQRIGLSDKASSVYIYLLQVGGAYPSAISEATHLNRSTIYKVLVDLSVKGLVTEVERGKKLFYQAEKPEKLLRFSRIRSEMVQEAFLGVHELMPELEVIYGRATNKPRIRYLQGKEGITSIYEDMVSEKKSYEMIGFSNVEAFRNYLPKKSLRTFVQAKEKYNITTRGIAPDTEANRQYNTTVFSGMKKAVWPKVRFVPKEMFPFEAEIVLYGGNKLAITKLSGENLIGIVIEDQFIYSMFKMIFEMLWRSDQVKE